VYRDELFGAKVPVLFAGQGTNKLKGVINMKKNCMRKAILFVMVFSIILVNLIVTGAGVGSSDYDPSLADGNLVQNPGFEVLDSNNLPIKWGWNDIWTPSDTAYAGNCSATYRRDDPNQYKLLTQMIPAQPDSYYRISCWIKTDNISINPEKSSCGAKICLEWSDTNGTFLGGYYTKGIIGTNDWQQVSGITNKIPAVATKIRVTVFITEGSTGQAWFDDLSVTKYDKPFEGQIQVPGSLGQVTGGTESDPVIISGQLGQTYLSQSICLTAKITSVDNGIEVVRQEITGPTDTEIALQLPTADLPSGKYQAIFNIYDSIANENLTELNSTFNKVAAAPDKTVTFRPDGIALVNNTPFFPLGVYEKGKPSDPASLDRLQEIASGGFNCVLNCWMNYGTLDQISQYMDFAGQQDLKCIYTLKDIINGNTTTVAGWNNATDMINGLVTRFKDKPSLLSWYLNDESPVSMHEQLLNGYQQVTGLDPNHPGYSVLNQVGELNSYLDTTDVFGVDPYPIPNQSILTVSDWTDKAVATQRPAWIVPQIFDWNVYKPYMPSVQPTLDQMRCMTYLSLTHGATGLVYYSYFDMKKSPNFSENWANITKITAEVRSIFPWLLSTERGEFKEINGLHTRYFQNGDQGLLMVVNPGDQTVSGQIPMIQSGSVIDISTGKSCVVTNNAIIDDIKPLDVKLYKIDTSSTKATETEKANTQPTITLNGESSITVALNSTYVDSGATAADAEDGDLTSKIVASGIVDTKVAGIYRVIFIVADSSGAKATAARTITVKENSPPVITLSGASKLTIAQYSKYADLGATATDREDGNLTSKIVATGTVNTIVTGTYTVTYSVTDSSGVTATTTRTVVVLTNKLPVITLNGKGRVSATQNSVYTDLGATASDVEDGNLTSRIVATNDVNTKVPGTYKVTYSVTDSSGATVIKIRTVIVIANKPPVITMIGVSKMTIARNSTYVDFGATATDTEDGNLTSRIVVTSTVNTQVAGTYKVTYSITDSSGATVTKTRTVYVK
jgi:hypothetical protein